MTPFAIRHHCGCTSSAKRQTLQVRASGLFVLGECDNYLLVPCCQRVGRSHESVGENFEFHRDELPEQFKGRIIFMSMYNDIHWTKRGNKETCIANALKITEYARRFPQGRWSFLGFGSQKRWYGNHLHKPDGEWDKTAEGMMLNFAESGHPQCLG